MTLRLQLHSFVQLCLGDPLRGGKSALLYNSSVLNLVPPGPLGQCLWCGCILLLAQEVVWSLWTTVSVCWPWRNTSPGRSYANPRSRKQSLGVCTLNKFRCTQVQPLIGRVLFLVQPSYCSSVTREVSLAVVMTSSTTTVAFSTLCWMFPHPKVSSSQQSSPSPLYSVSLRFLGPGQNEATFLTKISPECHLAQFLTESCCWESLWATPSLSFSAPVSSKPCCNSSLNSVHRIQWAC